MYVLVVNAGSSSLKYQVFNMENEEVIAKGVVEKIGVMKTNESGEKVPADGISKYTRLSDGKENKVPTEIIFEGGKPEKNKLPKNGDWVDVVGIVSSNSNGLSCIKDAKVTILNIEDKKEFAKWLECV